MHVLVVFLAILVLVIALPFWRERHRKVMDDTARRRAPGQFAQLSQGVTHYQWLGSARGPVAVCVHGLTTPSFVWQGIAAGLGRLGFRVLVYDLYGRGYSDSVRGLQDRAFFVRQLEDLLAHERVGDDLTLIGYSMGGTITAAWAADNLRRMRSLILIAPAGLTRITLSAQRRAMMRRGIGDWMMLAFYPRMHRKATEAERKLPTSVPGIVDLQQAELLRRGFVPSVLSSIRGILSESRAGAHLTLAKDEVPVLGIFGAEDRIIPLLAREQLSEWNPDAVCVTIAGAGHGLTYTHTDDILDAIRDFLRNVRK